MQRLRDEEYNKKLELQYVKGHFCQVRRPLRIPSSYFETTWWWWRWWRRILRWHVCVIIHFYCMLFAVWINNEETQNNWWEKQRTSPFLYLFVVFLAAELRGQLELVIRELPFIFICLTSCSLQSITWLDLNKPRLHSINIYGVSINFFNFDVMLLLPLLFLVN